jgi:hypothetical protein
MLACIGPGFEFLLLLAAFVGMIGVSSTLLVASSPFWGAALAARDITRLRASYDRLWRQVRHRTFYPQGPYRTGSRVELSPSSRPRAVDALGFVWLFSSYVAPALLPALVTASGAATLALVGSPLIVGLALAARKASEYLFARGRPAPERVLSAGIELRTVLLGHTLALVGIAAGFAAPPIGSALTGT